MTRILRAGALACALLLSLAPAGIVLAQSTISSHSVTDSGIRLDARLQALDAVDAGKQPLDSDLTAIAGVSTAPYGRSLLGAADASGLRSLAGVRIGTDVEAWDADLDALAGMTSPAATLAGAAQKSANLGDLASAATARSNLGLVAVASSGSAADLTTGTLPAGRLPAPTASTLGGVQSLAAVSHRFLSSLGTDGVLVAAQPAAADISGLAASATTDATNASNISTGTLAAARGGAGAVSGALKGNGAGVVSQAACADLSNAQNGCSTTVTAMASAASSADMRAALPDETGTGAAVFAGGNIGAASGISLALSGGTVATSTPVLDLSETWNGSGVTFTGGRLNITDTASAAGSILWEWQVAGAAKWGITKEGYGYGTGLYATRAFTPALTTAPIGIDLSSASVIDFWANSTTTTFRIASLAATVANGKALQFSAGNPNSADLFLTRKGAANLRLGAPDAAAPVGQTLSVQNVAGGTLDTAGVDFIITPSAGTGTGAGGKIRLQACAAGTTGTAQNSCADALTVNSDKSVTLAGGVAMGANHLTGVGSVRFGAGNDVRLQSTGAGSLTVSNNAQNDFGLLQLGGTSSSFPAWKRNGAALEPRLADDSARAGILAGAITLSSTLNAQAGQVVALRVVTASGGVTVTTSDYVVAINKTVGAATAVTLPAGVVGQVFIIKDVKGDAASNNITITPAAGTIDGSATYVINTNRGVVRLQWDSIDSMWLVI